MKALLLSALALLAPFSQEAQGPILAASKVAQEKEMVSIQNEIEALINLRDYYTARMMRFRSRAARLEYQKNADPAMARQFNEYAEQLEGIIEQIELEIVRLEYMLSRYR